MLDSFSGSMLAKWANSKSRLLKSAILDNIATIVQHTSLRHFVHIPSALSALMFLCLQFVM